MSHISLLYHENSIPPPLVSDRGAHLASDGGAHSPPMASNRGRRSAHPTQ